MQKLGQTGEIPVLVEIGSQFTVAKRYRSIPVPKGILMPTAGPDLGLLEVDELIEPGDLGVLRRQAARQKQVRDDLDLDPGLAHT